MSKNTRRRGNRKTNRSYKSQMPTDPAERERIERIDAAKKAASKEPQRSYRMLTAEQHAAVIATRNPSDEVNRVIRSGHRKPRTWDEINSSKGGGRDFARM